MSQKKIFRLRVSLVFNVINSEEYVTQRLKRVSGYTTHPRSVVHFSGDN